MRKAFNTIVLSLAFLGYALGGASDPDTRGFLFTALLGLYLGLLYISYAKFYTKDEVQKHLWRLLFGREEEKKEDGKEK